MRDIFPIKKIDISIVLSLPWNGTDNNGNLLKSRKRTPLHHLQVRN